MRKLYETGVVDNDPVHLSKPIQNCTSHRVNLNLYKFKKSTKVLGEFQGRVQSVTNESDCIANEQHDPQKPNE